MFSELMQPKSISAMPDIRTHASEDRKSIPKEHELAILSFRDRRHRNRVITELLLDRPIAFHGWGVSGAGKRVDSQSNYKAFWDLKKGRYPGSKIPLLELPEQAVKFIDWDSIHPDFKYLQNPKKFKKLWRSGLPFHLIFPYKTSSGALSEAVVTPAFDNQVAPDTPVPTICLFWVQDPALDNLVRNLKKKDPKAQLGVSSLNETHQMPPFNTAELLDHLKSKNTKSYSIVLEDPLVEKLDIASSHSQFVAPLRGEDPVWVMKRRGSLSQAGFQKATGLVAKGEESAKVASRRASPTENLDDKLIQAAKEIKRWNRGRFFRELKELLHLV